MVYYIISYYIIVQMQHVSRHMGKRRHAGAVVIGGGPAGPRRGARWPLQGGPPARAGRPPAHKVTHQGSPRRGHLGLSCSLRRPRRGGVAWPWLAGWPAAAFGSLSSGLAVACLLQPAAGSVISHCTVLCTVLQCSSPHGFHTDPGRQLAHLTGCRT